MNIKNKNLLINKCYVNGAWVSSDKKIKVLNGLNNSEITPGMRLKINKG